MEYLQYRCGYHYGYPRGLCFKPYYKWNTFNTMRKERIEKVMKVLNLIINGIPSIHRELRVSIFWEISFKPYYKWNTFNTQRLGD